MYLCVNFASPIVSFLRTVLLLLHLIHYLLYKMLAGVEGDKVAFTSWNPGISFPLFLIALNCFSGNINFLNITINQSKLRMKDIILGSCLVVLKKQPELVWNYLAGSRSLALE